MTETTTPTVPTPSTFSQLWDNLKARAATVIADVGQDIEDFVERIVPVIEADIAMILGQFEQLAIDTVMKFAQAEFDHLTGREKHSEVVTEVFQAAEAAGRQIAIEDVRMFAQQAYDAVASTLKPADQTSAAAAEDDGA